MNVSYYRLTPADGRGDLSAAESLTFEASNDMAALMTAERLSDGSAVEVWDQSRLVGVVAGRAPTRSDLARIADVLGARTPAGRG